MGRRFSFRAGADGTGSTLIPVADGEYFANDIDPVYGRGQCCLAFYNGDTQVAPTAGTIRFRASCLTRDGEPVNQYLTDSQDSTIQANTVLVGDATYTLAVFNGPAVRAKMTLDGIIGATHVIAYYLATE